jgi:outer membrane usher protein
MSGTWNDQKGFEHWDGSAQSHRYGENGETAVGASIGYTGNRGEVRVSHNSGLRPSSTLASVDQRSSVRAGTAIAFAGSTVAIGAPIRGNGFAIVAAHESIASRTVRAGAKEDPRAIADGLGPALVGNLPAYANTNLPVDVDDLPTGYSLGKGAFDVAAPYHAGYAFEVGSAYSVSAYGTLHDATDAPVALLTGTATAEADRKKLVAIFTNAAGKFGADGLAPGRWIIEMATDGAPTLFTIDIPKGTDGLFKAGILKPNAGGAEAKTS